MFCFAKPSRNAIRAFLAAQQTQPFSYVEVGASRHHAPPGYNIDHNRIELGLGPDLFARAKLAILRWSMFDMPWINLCWPDTPIEAGATVAVLASHFRFWSINACRIVYVIEHGPPQKYGFAYGTLPGHAARGEERFSVEYHPQTGAVWYDIYAFSRPRPPARLAYPFSRALQKRFARHSKAAMWKAVQSV
jgi:uncharacterized protein (UPF0548 family)